jgi:hypothetical protein
MSPAWEQEIPEDKLHEMPKMPNTAERQFHVSIAHNIGRLIRTIPPYSIVLRTVLI